MASEPTKEYLPEDTDLTTRFDTCELVSEGNGGAVYRATEGADFYVVLDTRETQASWNPVMGSSRLVALRFSTVDERETWLTMVKSVAIDIMVKKAQEERTLLSASDEALLGSDPVIDVLKKKTYHLAFVTDLSKQFPGIEQLWHRAEVEVIDADAQKIWPKAPRFYTATDAEGHGYVILDDRANAERLDNPDDRPIRDRLLDRLITVHEFETVVAMDAYVAAQRAVIDRIVRDAEDRPGRDADEGTGGAPVPAWVIGPTPFLPGAATRTFEESDEPPRNP